MPSRPPQTAYIPKVEPAPDGLDLLASKIGGRPYLVAGESWPSHNGNPMVRAGRCAVQYSLLDAGTCTANRGACSTGS